MNDEAVYQMTYLDEAVELFEAIVEQALQNREIVEAAITFEAKGSRRRMEDVTRCYYSIGDIPGSREARKAYERSPVKHVNDRGETLYFLDAVAYEIVRRRNDKEG